MSKIAEILIVATAAIALTSVAPAQAQDFPTRSVRVIVASGPGGVSDILMRALGERLHKNLKQPFVIENRTGGAFNIAAKLCADSPPDGYTLCVLPGEPVTYNQYLYKNIGFDPDKGFVPITNLFFITQALVANSSLSVTNLDQLARYSKDKAGTLSYTAPGLSQAMFVENFKKESGADMVRVPFKGGGDAISGMISNTTPVVFFGLGNIISYIHSGMATPFAVDSEKRSVLAPETPTLRELGYKADITRSYVGLFAPAGTPDAIVTKLYEQVAGIFADQNFRNEQMIQRGLEPVANTPAEFQTFIRADRLAAERVVKASGLQPH